MSKLDELLQGVKVEWLPLKEIAELQRGKTITAKNKTEGNIPVISGGQKPAYYNGEFNRTDETITIAGSGAYAGYISYWNEPIFVSDAFSIKPDLSIVNIKYAYYFLLTKQEWIYSLKKGAGIPHVYPKDLEKLQIPIPFPYNPEKSLEIQQEIVRVLDELTTLTNQLTTELETERQNRKKQFQFFREQLLSFKKGNVEWKTLGDIGNVKMCKRIFKNETKDFGDIPFYKIGTFGKTANAYISRELYEDYKEKYSYPNKGDILISAAGTIGRTVVFDGKPAYFQDSNIIWIENNQETIINEYLCHFYKVAKWYVSGGGTIDRLYNDNVRKTKIPVPFPNDKEKSLAEQKRIVKLLDQFDSTHTAIEEEITKEIKLRTQQYEYYREKLLSFPSLRTT